ncbi:hypothetical protein MauCBS54593_001772 [Microsporum audouinii]
MASGCSPQAGCTEIPIKPKCIEQGSCLDVGEIRENLRLLIDLSFRLPSQAVLSSQDSDIFRGSCSALEKVLTAQAQGCDGVQHQSPDGVESLGEVVSSTRGQVEAACSNKKAPQNDRELLIILDRLTRANEHFRQRRVEHNQIQEQYQTRCEKLSARVSELENEVNSLHYQVFNNTIELECMRGTVSGLETWLSHWKSQNDSSFHLDPILKRPSKPKGRRSKYFEQMDRLEEQRDSLLDGLSAWMRGWNDATDGFRARSMDKSR